MSTLTNSLPHGKWDDSPPQPYGNEVTNEDGRISSVYSGVAPGELKNFNVDQIVWVLNFNFSSNLFKFYPEFKNAIYNHR